MNSPLVAVTGATGFLGRRLVPALIERGWRVRLLARGPVTGLWPNANPEIVFGDLRDAKVLARLVEGTAAVVHAAGLIKALTRDAFFAVNATGSQAIADAARVAKTDRFLLVSSLAAREPALSGYAASKAAGESAARAELGDRVTILRPPAIYGPGDRETLGLFQLAARSPILPVPDAPSARLALAHVDDVVDRIVNRLHADWTPGVYTIGGARPEGYGWREIFSAAAAAMGRRPRQIALPFSIIRAAAAVSESLSRARAHPAIFNRGKARELAHEDWSVHPGEEIPGDTMSWIALDEGFKRTVAWYRAAGWLR